jgi:MFS family permease
VVGTAAAGVPMAAFASRRGRRPAVAGSYAIGATGAAMAITGADVGSFPLLSAGLFLAGWGTSAGQQARFAAVDRHGPESAHRRGRDLATIIWATTLGAIAGPTLAASASALSRAWAIPATAGGLVVAVIAFVAAALVVFALLRPEPLVVAALRARQTRASSWGVIRSRPAALGGMVVLSVGQAMMIVLRVVSPLRLAQNGASWHDIAVVMSLQVAGMYAAAPVIGHLVDRVGGIVITFCGLGSLYAVLLLTWVSSAGEVLLAGAVLFMAGVGWSCTSVAGSTLLSQSLPDGARLRIQGLSDMTMGVVASVAGFCAGLMVSQWSFGALWLLLVVVLTGSGMMIARLLAIAPPIKVCFPLPSP